MGMYDTVWFKKANGEHDGIQFKSGERLCIDYNLGDEVPLPNGIHFGYEGAFVVQDKKIIAIYDSDAPFMFDKWGGQIDFPDIG